MSEAVTNALESEATDAVKSATVDGRTVTGHDLTQLVEADKYLTQKAAADSSNAGARVGFRPFRTKPPGAV